jgi:hypothetical protein
MVMATRLGPGSGLTMDYGTWHLERDDMLVLTAEEGLTMLEQVPAQTERRTEGLKHVTMVERALAQVLAQISQMSPGVLQSRRAEEAVELKSAQAQVPT